MAQNPVIDEEAVALRLGRLVLACARVEMLVGVVAMQLGEVPTPLNMDKQVKAIRRRSRHRPDAHEFDRWVGEADDVLRQRGKLVHGSFIGVWDGGAERVGFIAHRGLKELSVDLDDLDALVQRARDSEAQAVRLNGLLWREIEETANRALEPDLGP